MLLCLNNSIFDSVNISKISFNAKNKKNKIQEQKIEDKAEIRPYNEVVNEKLLNEYGINSTVKSPEILNYLLESVEDFCSINNDKSLFKGLDIKEEPIKGNYIGAKIGQIPESLSSPYVSKEEFSLTFNTILGEKGKITEVTKNLYDKALIASSNPKYLFYESLAQFLNYNNNPEQYKRNLNTPIERFDERHNELESYWKLRRLTSLNSYADFSSSYIAAKMCGEDIPNRFDRYYRYEIPGNNINLKFPEIQKNDKKVFTSLYYAKEHLNNVYGINADLDNLKYANECISAVEELTKAIGDKKAFEGLEIITSSKMFREDEKAPAQTYFDVDNGISKIYINPKYNDKSMEYLCQIDYDDAINPSNTIKSKVFTHELVHWLDYNGNPEKCRNEHIDILNNRITIGDRWKNSMAKVSHYATKSPREFVAEYVCGRFAGNKYPKAVNDLFKEWYNGREIKFPDDTE